VFSVKRNRNGFAAFGKIPAVPCPFVMNGKEQRTRFQPSLGLSAVLDCFEIFVAVLFCRGVAVGNLRQRNLFEVGAVAKIDSLEKPKYRISRLSSLFLL
jgi:hypothetical protein